MPEVSSLKRAKLVTATATWEDEEITVVFDRSRVTMNWVAAVQAMMRTSDAAAMSELMSSVIDEWDITEDGSPYPPTAENLGELPAATLGAIFGAIETAAEPGAAEGNASGSTSSTAAKDSTSLPAPHQNGHTPSTSPEHSASLPTR